MPEHESFLREPPQFDKNHEIDLYERNLKEYTNMDTGDARQHENLKGIEGMTKAITIAMSPREADRAHSSMLQY
jgi:hypothetical protein